MKNDLNSIVRCTVGFTSNCKSLSSEDSSLKKKKVDEK